MKKLVTLTTTFALVLITTALVQAKEAPKNLTANIQRAAANQTPVYLNDRVKTMCAEWTGCKEWVASRVQANPTFRVTDAEAERWVKKWELNQFGSKVAVWDHRFYVQTIENGQTKAYKFERTRTASKDYNYHAPVLIKKFPGHPIAGNPSKHIKWSSNKNDACDAFPGCREWMWKHGFGVEDAVGSQYISNFDEKGEAIWTYKLYVKVSDSFSFFNYYFTASQSRHNGSYAYSAPKEMGLFPKYPEHPF